MGDTLSRFNIPGNKNIKVYDLEDCIHKAEATSLEFKAKFILFAIGCLLCPRSGTYIDKSYYSCLTEDMFKGRVDWATHVYTVLINGIADFKSQKANAYVTGCIMILQVEVNECEHEDFQNIHDAMKNSWTVNSPGLDEQGESPMSKSSKEMDLDGDDHDFEGPTVNEKVVNEKIHCCEEIQALKCEVIATNEKVDLTNEKVDLVQGLLSSFGDEIGWIKRQMMLLVEQRNLEARMNMGGTAGSVRDECDECGNFPKGGLGSTAKVRVGEKRKQCFMDKSIDINEVPKSNGNGLGSDERGAPDLGVRSFRGFKSGEKRSSSVRRPQKKNTNGISVGKIKRKLYFGPDCRERCRKNGTPGSNSSKINAGNSKEGSAHNPFIVEPDIHNKVSTDGETDSPRSGGSIKFNHVYRSPRQKKVKSRSGLKVYPAVGKDQSFSTISEDPYSSTQKCYEYKLGKILLGKSFKMIRGIFVLYCLTMLFLVWDGTRSWGSGSDQSATLKYVFHVTTKCSNDCGVFTMKFMMSRNGLPYMDVRCDNDERYRLAGMLSNSSLNDERPTVMGVLSTTGLI
ncbi:hypothetical protein COLO4_28381 [Corchorus olitorius]|uniref:Ubiquitin-like protease family profile domain-containing protein n=1 Tax=Corchorus olitorius TaxID=93759 RepID=A0A1R3HLF0_9ROSI|nr:hypothetical protein COLO4_28381 [Corchorus olitorius]